MSTVLIIPRSSVRSNSYYSVLHLIMIMIYKLPKLFRALCYRSADFTFSQSKKWDPTKYSPFPVEEYDVGQRLDRYLKNTKIGWTSAQKYLRNNDIFVLRKDGDKVSQNKYRFQVGDQIMIRTGKDIEQYLIGDKNIDYIQLDQDAVREALDSMTVFDNHNITVLNKLPGYSVQGGPDPNKNIFSLMASRFKKDMIYISHRLDKPTTGLVFISKNVKTAQILGEALEKREGISKYYLGMTEGKQIIDKVGTISCQLEWTSKHKARISQNVTKSQNTQLGVTKYVRLRQKQLSDNLWRNLLGLNLVTGRKHQIRCHLSQYLLNPIINDELYLGRKSHSELNAGIFLHSFALNITKPEIIEGVFGFRDSKKGIIVENERGSMEMRDKALLILGKLPKIWQPFNETISNKDLKEIHDTIEVDCKSKKLSKQGLIKIE